MDIMKTYGYKLDLEYGTLEFHQEEVVLQPREDNAVRAVVTDDVVLEARSETLIVISDRNIQGSGWVERLIKTLAHFKYFK